MADRIVESSNRLEELAQITPGFVIRSIQANEKWAGDFNKLLEVDPDQVKVFLTEAVNLYQLFERVAQRPLSEQVRNIKDPKRVVKALYVPSAPGIFFDAFKNDRYKDFPWSKFMDRKQVLHALAAAREIAQKLAGQEIPQNIVEANKFLQEFGPKIIYAGRPDEDEAIMEAARASWLRIPESHFYPSSKISVLDLATATEKNDPNTAKKSPQAINLLDQVKHFKLPGDVDFQAGDRVGIVIHAPQAVRMLYMMEQFPNAFPQSPVEMFTLPAPKGSIPEYPLMEIRATAYYHFVANPPVAASAPFPFSKLYP